MAKCEQLDLRTLKEGDLVRAIAGVGNDAYKYDFLVLKPGEMPQCLLTQTDPKGVVTGPATVVLEGTGRWLTPKENPCQTYLPEKQITIGFGMMYIGGSVVIYDPEDHSGNRAELMPTCTEIEVYAA